jgi:hypothetical protein
MNSSSDENHSLMQAQAKEKLLSVIKSPETLPTPSPLQKE